MEAHYTATEIREAIVEHWPPPPRWGARLRLIAEREWRKKIGLRRHMALTPEGIVHEAVRKLLETEADAATGYRNIPRRYKGDDPAERARDLFLGVARVISSEVSNLAGRASSQSNDLPDTLNASTEHDVATDDLWALVFEALQDDEVSLAVLRLRRDDPELRPRDLAEMLEMDVKAVYRANERMKKTLQDLFDEEEKRVQG
ncbi:MAG: hypothetical protein AAGF99_04480 [Bacteroidota bacterium]